MRALFTPVKGNIAETSEEVTVFEGFPYYFYEVKRPDLSKNDQIVLSVLTALLEGKKMEELRTSEQKQAFPSDSLKDFIEKTARPYSDLFLQNTFLTQAEMNDLKIALEKFLLESKVNVQNLVFVVNRAIDVSVGFGVLGPMIRDDQLEEIMVNGIERNVFVFHRKFGMCKSNVLLSQTELDSVVKRISVLNKKQFGENRPFLDSRLLDGERINATFSSVTPLGATLTIRKFTATPLSVVDLIERKTISSELAAFLWLMVEGFNVKPMNILVAGGSGSGKTTTLNVLCSFVRHSDRVITIEDTAELNLGSRENWVKMETQPKIFDSAEITMDDLLRNSLRMRPDRVVLGEVRGVEAQTLFVAMDIGHEGSMGTLHANNSNEVMVRLTSHPMSVPESMISLLDLVIVQSRMQVKGKGTIRRITQVSEVSSLEKKALIATIFEWDRTTDQIKRTDIPSAVIETLADKTQMTKKEVMKEIIIRKRILEYMVAKKIRETPEVEMVIQKYYFDPESVLEMVVKELRQ